MFDEYSSINKEIDKINVQRSEKKPVQLNPSLSTISQKNLPLEKIPLPCFDGEIRLYSRFRNDFIAMVLTTVRNKKQAAFVLRQCLSKSIIKSVASCEDDVNVILQRLDDKYADPGKITDAIISDIRKFRSIESHNNRRLIEFINLSEWGYNDLKAAQM